MEKISFLKKIDVKGEGWLPQLDDSSSSHYIASNSNADISKKYNIYIFMLYFTSEPSSCCWARGKFKCSWDKDTDSPADCPITNHLNLKKMKGLSENIVNFDNISIYEWHLNLIGIFHQNFFGGKSHILDRKEVWYS